MDTPTEPRPDPRIDGLWRNCSDSLVHALSHFEALDREGDSFHNRKWAVLSAAANFARKVYVRSVWLTGELTTPRYLIGGASGKRSMELAIGFTSVRR